MYTVLIVDDEPAILMGIRKTFSKIDLGFEVLWEAQSSKNAFDIICKQRPDVVVTDIRMPVINGIELMKMIRAQNIDTEFIVISGFEEFKYAKEALNVGAFGYLSKPIQREEVYNLLMRLTAYMDQKILGKDIRIYEDIVYKKISIDSLFPQNLYKYYQFVFAFSQDGNISMTKQALTEENTSIIAIKVGFNKCLFIINSNCDITESFMNKYNSNNGIANISFGISNLTVNTEDAPNLIRQAEIASYSSFIYGSHNIYKYTNNRSALKKIYSSIKISLENNDFTEFNNIITNMKSTFICNNLNIENITVLWNYMLAIIAEKYENDIEKFDMKFMNNEQLIMQFKNIDDLAQYLVDLISLLNDEAAEQLDNKIKADSIKNILDYIHVNYCDPDISLNKISEIFYLNMAYCSVLFKKCTGMTYSEYLTSIRMNKACELLKDAMLSVEEVSYKIGYHDYFYFNRVFKKNIGITPANYKRLNS